MADLDMEKVVALCNNRGFIYPGSDLYGGLANSWDYGPYGVELKRNLKELWWNSFIRHHQLNVGVDASILMNPKVWEASGHLSSFSDPLIDCKSCHSRFRADQLVEGYWQAQGVDRSADGMSNQELMDLIEQAAIPCPSCGAHDFTDIRQFNLMYKTYQGVTEDAKVPIYLRPETAQGIFVNFANIQRTSRRKIPFGIGQIGKAFRNEITPGNFTFRTREFEQMELEFFCEPGSDLEWFDYWEKFISAWLKDLGMRDDNLRIRAHEAKELSFYSKATSDFEFRYPFGWGELWGLADRTDYDLKRHMEVSKLDLRYFDPESQEKYLPYVVEPSVGVERLLLAFLCNAYEEETLADGKTRVVLHFDPRLAPVKIAVLPLSKKLGEPASQLAQELGQHFIVEYDENQSIGKRYRRQDEIGTPYCVTFDFDSQEDGKVTVRERDSMEQVRIAIPDLVDYFTEKLGKRKV